MALASVRSTYGTMIVAGWLHVPSLAGVVPLARTRAHNRVPLGRSGNVVLLAATYIYRSLDYLPCQRAEKL